ncbi:hypothetical protein FDP41_011771 [Naegleria fowleri]|uniref:Ubiquitin carboxyl-terminal hydrolase n=1 Tax=Naegleria fowleri TaxID=5763 RepID=A0A6A5C7Y6_NAEFO|nr:uncharacterized protein FDP41_011771 [Naegleria fowleri]KAF0981910.1 hypothetical protein FDP41_011771 [Naegleria fowleri]
MASEHDDASASSSAPAQVDNNKMDDEVQSHPETNNHQDLQSVGKTGNSDHSDAMITDEDDQASSSAPTTSFSLEKFYSEFQRLIQQHSMPTSEGETWYIVEGKWMGALANMESSHCSPGPIDNSLLISPESDPQNPRLKDGLQEQSDYDLVPEEIWNLFIRYFGGGPAIPRKTVIVNKDSIRKTYTVEVYPYEISVAVVTNENVNELDWVDYEFSKNDTIDEVFEKVKRDFNLQNKECKLWKAIMDSPSEEVNVSILRDETLENLLERKVGQRFIIEVGPKWSIDTSSLEESHANAMRTASNSRIQITGKTAQERRKMSYETPGVCGLANLGNTCFMNSGLQCLTHTPVFYEYFVNDHYVKEINKTNVLGMGGAMAIAFGNLMKEMWSGEHSYVSPVEFKRVIGKYAPQFAGYQQQDSQELISFLLDGLHEDLNRVKDKPSTTPVEAKGREDAIVAKESWETHKLRNNSIIVDKFQGQLKSTLHCPKCDNVSITFDPFMYLTLPIPVEKNRKISFLMFLNNTYPDEIEQSVENDNTKISNMPIKISCIVNKHGSVSELRDAVLDQLSLNPKEDHDRCLIYEIFNNRVYKFLSDHDPISGILDNDTLHCQIMPKISDLKYNEWVFTGKSFERLLSLPPNVHALYSSRQSYGSSSSSQQLPFLQVKLTSYDRQFEQIGCPFVIPLGKIYESKTQEGQEVDLPTNADIYEYCFYYMLRYFSKDFLNTTMEYIKQNNFNIYDLFPTKQKIEEIKKRAFDRTATVDDSLNSIFYISDGENHTRFNEETLDGVIPCDDSIFVPPVERPNIYGKTSKKTIFMHIPAQHKKQLLDYNALTQFKEHPSLSQKVSSGEGCSIYQCLESFTSMEKLSANDTWYCPTCKDHVQATKKFDIWKVPDVLVVHLKRFSFTSYSRDKIDRFIDFPIQDFDLSSYVKCKENTDPKYDLFAISDHFGGLGGGHYTACAKNHLNGKWYKFDDSRTAEISNAESMKSHSNYVLFYVRKE